ncbi:MAG: PEGA domain-containing protein, partial [Lentisphaeria bacterium]
AAAPEAPPAADLPPPADPRLKVTLLVQNRAGEEFRDRLDGFQDLLQARLANLGLALFNPKLVIAKFAEQPPAANDAELQQVLKQIQALCPAQGVGPTPADSVTGAASAVRLGQLIGADYTIVAAILSTGRETRTFKGAGTAYGTDNQSIVTTLRATLTILDANGGTLAGDTVTVQDRIQVQQGLTVERQGIADDLLDKAAEELTSRVADKILQVRQTPASAVPGAVSFTVNTNIPACNVEIDGATVGSAPGSFQAAPGLHQLRITREWLTPWERTVNLSAGQVLTVQMELSADGARRFKDIEAFKQDQALQKIERLAVVDIAKEQSAATAHAVRTVADGQGAMLKKSNFKLRGSLYNVFWGAPPAAANTNNTNVNVITK